MAAKLNYAVEYQRGLEQEFPYVLYFGALFSTPNNGRYRWVNSNVIEIPTIKTTGRVDGVPVTINTPRSLDRGNLNHVGIYPSVPAIVRS